MKKGTINDKKSVRSRKSAKKSATPKSRTEIVSGHSALKEKIKTLKKQTTQPTGKATVGVGVATFKRANTTARVGVVTRNRNIGTTNVHGEITTKYGGATVVKRPTTTL